MSHSRQNVQGSITLHRLRSSCVVIRRVAAGERKLPTAAAVRKAKQRPGAQVRLDEPPPPPTTNVPPTPPSPTSHQNHRVSPAARMTA